MLTPSWSGEGSEIQSPEIQRNNFAPFFNTKYMRPIFAKVSNFRKSIYVTKEN